MADTTKRLAGPSQLANSATTIYTVPGSTSAVIRMIHFSNPTVADKTVTMSIGADAAATRIFDAFTIPAGSVFGYPCHIAMATAEIVQASASAVTSVVVVLSGIEIT